MAFRFHQLFLASVLLVLSVITAVSAAGRHLVQLSAVSPVSQPNPNPNPINATEQFLTGQNEARAAVGVEPLSWNPMLGSYASRYVRYQRDRKGCEFAALEGQASPYGANQAWASYPATPAEVVALWVESRKYYDYANNSCAAPGSAGHECGTYTQVVWRKTVEMGCAQATCSKGATLTICLYNPHGNVQGDRPY